MVSCLSLSRMFGFLSLPVRECPMPRSLEAVPHGEFMVRKRFGWSNIISKYWDFVAIKRLGSAIRFLVIRTVKNTMYAVQVAEVRQRQWEVWARLQVYRRNAPGSAPPRRC